MAIKPTNSANSSNVAANQAKGPKAAESKDTTPTKKKENRDNGEKLAVKDVQEAVPKYQMVKSSSDLDRVFISDDKKEEKRIAKSAKKILKKINFDAKLPDHQFIDAHIAKGGIDPVEGSSKLVVNMTGELALDRYFKTGITTTLLGWVPRVFLGGANKSIGNKWLKGNHGFNLYDPKKEHSHLEDPKRVREMLKSGRYALNVMYKSDAQGNFSKEPESISLIDRMGKALDETKENLKNAPKAVRENFEKTAERLNDEKLHTFCMINTLMINPKSEANYETSDKAAFYRQTLLASLLESFDNHTNFIIPSNIFAGIDTKTDKYQYDDIKNLHFLDMDVNKGVVNNFATTTANLVRNTKLYPDSIPEQDLADLMSMSMLSEHIKNPNKLNKKLMKKVNETIGTITSINTESFKKLNERLKS